MPMASHRTFRFGAAFTGAYDSLEWAELARKLESEGFSTLLVADHYDNPMSCGPMLMAAANATTTLRVGSYVYNNDLRHPALLAKEAATIDVLSGGRVELGVGAGWNDSEYASIGLPFDPGGVRADRFEEGIEVITRLFTGEQVHYEGQHYRLNGLEGAPMPIQRPLPLLIGGGGPRMIRFAARRADIVGFVPQSLPGGGLDPAKFSAEAMDTKIALLEAGISDAGRMDGGPERNVLIFSFYPSVAEITSERWISRDLASTSPYALIGDVDAIVDKILERRERWGLTYYVCADLDVEKFVPIVRKLAGRNTA